MAGALIKVVGAPVAMVFDAVSYLASGLLIASVPMGESLPPFHEMLAARWRIPAPNCMSPKAP